MQKPCPNCPLRDPELLERFCPRCGESFPWDALNDPYKFHELGNLLYQSREFSAAADAFRAAQEHSEHFLVASAFNLALSLLRLSRFQDALVTIDEVIDDEPLPEALYLKGLTLRYLERWDDAAHWLEQADEAGNEKAEHELRMLPWRRYADLSQCEPLADHPEKRFAYFKGLLSTLDSTSEREQAPILAQMGKAAVQLGHYTTARRYFTRACQVDLSAETASELAEFVLDHGNAADSETAEHYLHQALTLNPNHAAAHHCLARLRSRQGRLTAAYHCMLHALNACPTDEEILFDTAELSAERGDISFSLALLTRLEALADTDQDHFWVDRARCLRRGIGVC
ncbi:MAG: tetratricopeptide repeat protein [Pirellulaceae bacterium]